MSLWSPGVVEVQTSGWIISTPRLPLDYRRWLLKFLVQLLLLQLPAHWTSTSARWCRGPCSLSTQVLCRKPSPSPLHWACSGLHYGVRGKKQQEKKPETLLFGYFIRFALYLVTFLSLFKKAQYTWPPNEALNSEHAQHPAGFIEYVLPGPTLSRMDDHEKTAEHCKENKGFESICTYFLPLDCRAQQFCF